MLTFPNCKINLGLYITARREDGFHNLETIFYPVYLRDALEIIPAKNVETMHLSGKVVAGDSKDNLVWKAYKLLQAQFPTIIPQLDIYLHKAIPMGAGLGGGSADGAFMLRLLNKEFNLRLTDHYLAELALTLGSDCPFFIYNTPQFAAGRGEQMSPIAIDLSGFSIQLICPRVHVSTAQAFKMITPRHAPFNLKELPQVPVKDWKHTISNDFEAPIFLQHPVLESIKQQLYTGGAVYASMSGSGSAIYGIFHKGGRAVINADIQFEEHYLE